LRFFLSTSDYYHDDDDYLPFFVSRTRIIVFLFGFLVFGVRL